MTLLQTFVVTKNTDYIGAMASPQRDVDNPTSHQEEKEGDAAMSYDYSQESYWDGAAFYQQSLVTTPLDTGFYEAAPLGIAVSVLHLLERIKML